MLEALIYAGLLVMVLVSAGVTWLSSRVMKDIYLDMFRVEWIDRIGMLFVLCCLLTSVLSMWYFCVTAWLLTLAGEP